MINSKNNLKATMSASRLNASLKKKGMSASLGESRFMKDHAKLSHLGFEESGHTGFAGIQFGTTTEWDAQPEYCPLEGTLVVYTDYQVVIGPETSEVTTIPNIKIGDGETSLINLPFVSGGILYCGITSTALYDGSNTNPIIINDLSYTAKKGDLVIVDRSAVAVQYTIKTSYESNIYIINDNKYYITNTAISSDENVSFASIKNKLDILKANPQFLFDGAAWNILGSIAENFEVIKKVASIDDIPDDELGLYRFTEEKDGVVQSSHIYENVKEDHGAEEVVFEKITDTNNTNLTISTFFDQFNSSLVGLMSISAASGIYALRYAHNGETVENGIRFGTGSAVGSITFTTQTDCAITFKWYYSYNGSTGEIVSYDGSSRVLVDGVENSFADETTPLTINLTAGTHTISSYYGGDSSTRGRIILSLLEFEGEPYSIYSKHALARLEEVNAVATALSAHITTSNNRFAEDERAINTNRTDILDINNRMGDIQAFQAVNNLPYPSQQYLNKVYRLDNKFYQCVQKGDGELKEITFDTVTGTSEITQANVSGFITDLDREDFSTYYYLDETIPAWSKLFRSNGDIRIGSSSFTGYIRFYLQSDYIENLPCTKLKIGFKSYNANGSSVGIELEQNSGITNHYNYFIDTTDTETIVDLSSYLDVSDPIDYIDIYTEETHDIEGETINNDKRTIVTRLIAEFGTVEYEWKEIGCSESSEGKDDNFVWTRRCHLDLETESPINILITQKRKQPYHRVRVDTWKNKRGGSLLDVNIQNLKNQDEVVPYENILNAIFNLNFQRVSSLEMQQNDWDSSVWNRRQYKYNSFNESYCSEYVYICDLGNYEDFTSKGFYAVFFEAHSYMDAIESVFGNDDEGFYLDEGNDHYGIKNKPIVIKFIKNPIVVSNFNSYRGKICKNGLKISLTMVRPTKTSNIYLYAYVVPIILE